MTAGELLVRTTAWLAFAAYVGGTVAGLRHPSGRTFRLVWLAGAVFLLVHLLAAFHFKHGWSHATAYADTARQTREVTGLDWGGGVYLNYLLVIVWLADATSRVRTNPIVLSLVLRRVLTVFYAFMWFNAAVVFVRNPMRWVGAAAFVLLAVFAWRCSRPASGAPVSDPAR
jgi:hypothetical protein